MHAPTNAPTMDPGPTNAARLACQLRLFEDGRIGVDELRAFRVPLGVYAQRSGTSYMVRVRCPAGLLTPRQLRAIALSAERFGSGRLHLTTRQEVQIHDVPLAATPSVLDGLREAGLDTRGTGGNTVRNITASVGPGAAAGDGFEVGGYALALSRWVTQREEFFGLPRKLKIAFARSDSDDVGAQLNDLGFVAEQRGGVRGFAVYVAGGLGARPRVARLLQPFVPCADGIRVAAAVLRVYSAHGNRENRSEARLRFLWEQLGEKEFRRLYADALARTRLEQLPDLTPVPPLAFAPIPAAESVAPSTVPGPDAARWLTRYGANEAAPGLVSTIVAVSSGELRADAARALSDEVEAIGDDALRLTPSQNLLIQHLPLAWADRVYGALRARFPLMDGPRILAEGVSCAGASTCLLGICLSHNAIRAVRERLAQSSLPLDELTLRIRVSGCPNNCGRHSGADLGFSGKAARSNGQLYPAYSIVAGARSGSSAKLAEAVGEVPARSLPAFVESALAAYVVVRDRYASFADYVEQEGGRALRDLAARIDREANLAEVTAWVDWGAEDRFSLEGRSPGECSAGP